MTINREESFDKLKETYKLISFEHEVVEKGIEETRHIVVNSYGFLLCSIIDNNTDKVKRATLYAEMRSRIKPIDTDKLSRKQIEDLVGWKIREKPDEEGNYIMKKEVDSSTLCQSVIALLEYFTLFKRWYASPYIWMEEITGDLCCSYKDLIK